VLGVVDPDATPWSPPGADGPGGPPTTVVRAGGGALPWVVAAVLAGALGLLALAGLAGGGIDDGAAPPPDPPPAPPEAGPGPGDRGADGLVARIEGPVPPGLPAGAVALVGPGARTLWLVPLDGGPVQRIEGPPELAAVDAPGYNPAGASLVGRTIGWGDGIGLRLLPTDADADVDRRVAVTAPLGAEWAPVREVVPDPDGHSLWARTAPSGADVIWRLDVATLAPLGRVVVSDGESTRPAGLTLLGATRRGPLVRWPGTAAGAGLWILDPDGGPHRRIADDVLVLAVGPGHLLVELDAAADPAPADGPSGLAVVDVDSGAVRPLPAGSSPRASVAAAAFSPDGRHLALVASGALDDAGELVVVDLGAGTRAFRAPVGSMALGVAWTADSSTAIVLDADHPRRWRLLVWPVGADGLERLPVAVDLASRAGPRNPALLGHLAGVVRTGAGEPTG